MKMDSGSFMVLFFFSSLSGPLQRALVVAFSVSVGVYRCFLSVLANLRIHRNMSFSRI